jgi:hypothetical protein
LRESKTTKNNQSRFTIYYYIYPQNKNQKTMVIHGNKSFKGGSEKLTNITCENCGGKHTTELTCYHSYYHAFFIPVFPNRRRFITQCSGCGYIGNIEPKKEPAFQYLSKKYPNPVWMWVGIPVYGAFFAWIIYTKFFKNN